MRRRPTSAASSLARLAAGPPAARALRTVRRRHRASAPGGGSPGPRRHGSGRSLCRRTSSPVSQDAAGVPRRHAGRPSCGEMRRWTRAIAADDAGVPPASRPASRQTRRAPFEADPNRRSRRRKFGGGKRSSSQTGDQAWPQSLQRDATPMVTTMTGRIHLPNLVGIGPLRRVLALSAISHAKVKGRFTGAVRFACKNACITLLLPRMGV